MKVIIKNILKIITRFKVTSFLNFTGLIFSFTAFLILLMFVNSERSFDSCHKNAQNIYRLERVYPDETSWIQARAFADAVINSSPYIKAGTIINPFVPELYFTVNPDDNVVGYKERVVSCYSEITDVFDFKLIEGDAGCLKVPGQILIPQSMANKIFGKSSAIGQQLKIEAPVWTLPDVNSFVVGGVYKDFPENTQLNNCIYIRMADDHTVTDWSSGNYICYLLIENPAETGTVLSNFNSRFDFSLIGAQNDQLEIGLTPLKEIYFFSDSEDDSIIKTGNKDLNRILLFIALLILFIATINYVNFSTSLIPVRIKSINTYKIFGSTDSFLRNVILSEALLFSFISFLLSLGAVELINRMGYLSFLKANLSLSGNITVISIAGILSLFIGCLAGIYPSWKMTSYTPALVLKGLHRLSPSGLKMRTVLISFQFIISFALIITALMIRDQNNYMQSYNTGFNTDQIIIVPLSTNMYDHKTVYENQLKESPGIEEVAYSKMKFGGSDTYRTWGGSYQDKNLWFYSLSVSWNFTDVMGIKLYAGESPTINMEQGSTLYYIPNRKMQSELDMELNSKIDIPWMDGTPNSIIAFSENINFTSLRQEVNWSCLVVNDWEKKDHSYIKVKAGSNMHEVIDHIRTTAGNIDPGFPVEIQFYDEIFRELYYKELNISKTIYLFSLLAIIISLMGIFGLILFETQYRVKEIGIRKVHGATRFDILWIFNDHYVKILLGCFVFSIPIAMWGINEWLKSFAYKTPLQIKSFFFAFLYVLVLTIITITSQCWKAANINPARTIKEE